MKPVPAQSLGYMKTRMEALAFSGWESSSRVKYQVPFTILKSETEPVILERLPAGQSFETAQEAFSAIAPTED